MNLFKVNCKLFFVLSLLLNQVLSEHTSGQTAPINQRTANDSTWLLTGNVGTSSVTDYIGTNDLEDFVIRTNALERLRVKADGAIGIGTVSPSTSLEIIGDFRAGDGSNYFQINPGGDGFFKGTGDYLVGPVDWIWRYQFDEDYGQMFYTNGGNITEYRYTTSGAATIYELDANTGRVHVYGDLGVGTASPAGKLDVRGTAYIGDASGTDYTNIDATGNLRFSGTAQYLVRVDQYAFKFDGSSDYGLLFSAVDGYSFRNATNNPIFSVHHNTSKGTFSGALDINGNLQFPGSGNYQVGPNRYAFQYTLNNNFGLYFNATDGQYEFHDNNSLPSLSVKSVTGNTYIKGNWLQNHLKLF